LQILFNFLQLYENTTSSTAPGELQEQLNDIMHALDTVQENRRDLDEYAIKARGVIDAINNSF
jgi:hypothetical protein